MISFFVALFLCGVSVSVAQPTTPALKISLVPSTLQYIASLIQPILVQKLKSTVLPSFSDKIGTPIGDIQLDVTQCVWTAVNVGQLNVLPYQAASNNELEVAVAINALGLNCHWHYRKTSWPHISDSGTADVSFASTSISSVVALLNNNGHPAVNAIQCSISIGSFGLKLHGGASWLYNLFLGAFKGNIESAIESAIDKAVCSEIDNQLNGAFASLPIELPFGKKLGVDYALLGAPIVDAADGIVLPCLGEFYDQSVPGLDPCAGQPVPNSVIGNRMIQFVVGSCAADSIFYALQNAGMLSVMVDNQNLPPNVGLQLTTDYFEFIIPSLYA